MSTEVLRYVYLEMIIKKDAKYDVIAGLFKGIIERAGDKFVLLSGIDKDQTNVLNLKYYNIMSMEVLETTYKNMFYLTSTEDDQVAGLKILNEHYQRLIDAKLNIASDPSIIDINKYTDVPKDYLEAASDKSTTANGASSNINTVGGAFSNTNYNKAYHSTYKPAEKKEIVPVAFSRSDGKKPTAAMLAIMAEKMDAIAAGEFVVSFPQLVESGEIVTAGAKSYTGEGKYYSYMNEYD